MFLLRRLTETDFSRPSMSLSCRFLGFAAFGARVITLPDFEYEKRIRKFIFPFCWFSWFRGADLHRRLNSRQTGKPN